MPLCNCYSPSQVSRACPYEATEVCPGCAEDYCEACLTNCHDVSCNNPDGHRDTPVDIFGLDADEED